MAYTNPATDIVETPVAPSRRDPAELSEIVTSLAGRPDAWIGRVRLRSGRRWYERLHLGADYDVWLITWLPGQSTGFHDHGESAGAFAVAMGTLEEHRLGHEPHEVRPGESRTFGSSYTHDVRNGSAAPAVSIHAYSPPLTEMTHYEVDGAELVPAAADDDRGGQTLAGPASIPATRSIADVLETARGQLRRLSPGEASQAIEHGGAVLVDIRPGPQRAREGEIPGALIVERNVLEWRFDPASDARLAVAGRYDLQVIVFCSEGYTSSLAAAALQEIGLWRATDIVGGYRAWQAAGLRVSDGTAAR